MPDVPDNNLSVAELVEVLDDNPWRNVFLNVNWVWLFPEVYYRLWEINPPLE
jgi:hypothetical protein